MNELILADAKRYVAKESIRRITIFGLFVTRRGFRATYIYRQKQYHRQNGNSLRLKFWICMHGVFCNYIFFDHNAQVGGGLFMPHAFGIVIGAPKIGTNCTIYHNVTIAASYRTGNEGTGCPIMGDNVTVSPGAVVLGPINLGSNVIIGANSVVTKDFSSNVVIAGVPAKVIGNYNDERFG
jgi:serine O-acetyltransferase